MCFVLSFNIDTWKFTLPNIVVALAYGYCNFVQFFARMWYVALLTVIRRLLSDSFQGNGSMKRLSCSNAWSQSWVQARCWATKASLLSRLRKQCFETCNPHMNQLLPEMQDLEPGQASTLQIPWASNNRDKFQTKGKWMAQDMLLMNEATTPGSRRDEISVYVGVHLLYLPR